MKERRAQYRRQMARFRLVWFALLVCCTATGLHSLLARDNTLLPIALMAVAVLGLVFLFASTRRMLQSFSRVHESLAVMVDQLQALLQANPDIIVFKDHSGRWQLANEAAARELHLNGSEYRGRSTEEFELSPDALRFLQACAEREADAWSTGQTHRDELPLERYEEHPQVFDVLHTPVYSRHTDQSGTLMIGRNITPLKDIQAELERKNSEVTLLKNKQDGDYFLTSLLIDQFLRHENEAELIDTNVLHAPFKQFRFREKALALGGDLSLVHSLKFARDGRTEDFLFVVNADAMGKSMQGAGGALVFGAALQSHVGRVRQNPNLAPEDWLRELYAEMANLFLTFNGSMAISAIAALVSERTGEMYYFNAEHPFPVLLREGKASFMQSELNARKIGFESEFPFELSRFQLQTGDVLYFGSDGKDDLILHTPEHSRRINEDPRLFLRLVEDTGGNWKSLIQKLTAVGERMDDLSLVRIAWRGTTVRTREALHS